MTHINLNDDTVAGLKHRSHAMFSVQYHPEASPGPHDSHYLFKDFRSDDGRVEEVKRTELTLPIPAILLKYEVNDQLLREMNAFVGEGSSKKYIFLSKRAKYCHRGP